MSAEVNLGELSRDDLATQQHWRDLVRFLTRRLKCEATAEDLAQDAYLRMLQSAQPIVNARAFLFHVGANLANNHRRLERRRAELRAEIHDLLSGSCEEALGERNAMAAERLRVIAAVLPTLPDRTREILLLSRLEGLSSREIGRRLGISGTAVEKHLQKALLRLMRASESAKAPRSRVAGPAAQLS